MSARDRSPRGSRALPPTTDPRRPRSLRRSLFAGDMIRRSAPAFRTRPADCRTHAHRFTASAKHYARVAAGPAPTRSAVFHRQSPRYVALRPRRPSRQATVRDAVRLFVNPPADGGAILGRCPSTPLQFRHGETRSSARASAGPTCGRPHGRGTDLLEWAHRFSRHGVILDAHVPGNRPERAFSGGRIPRWPPDPLSLSGG